MAELLRVRNLRISLPSRQGMAAVVDGVDLEVSTGEVVGVAGRAGAGRR